MNRSNETDYQSGVQSCLNSDHASFQIWIDGRLDVRLASWFGATEIRRYGQSQGRDQTMLLCPVADESDLHRLVRKLRLLGLTLAAFKRIDTVPSSD